MPIDPNKIVDNTIKAVGTAIRLGGTAVKTGKNIVYENKMSRRAEDYLSGLYVESEEETCSRMPVRKEGFFSRLFRRKKNDINIEKEFLSKLMGLSRTDDDLFHISPKNIEYKRETHSTIARVSKSDIQHTEEVKKEEIKEVEDKREENKTQEILDFAKELTGYTIKKDLYYNEKKLERNRCIKDYEFHMHLNSVDEILNSYRTELQDLFYKEFCETFRELSIFKYITDIADGLLDVEKASEELHEANKTPFTYDFLRLLQAGVELEAQRRGKVLLKKLLKNEYSDKKGEYSTLKSILPTGSFIDFNCAHFIEDLASLIDNTSRGKEIADFHIIMMVHSYLRGMVNEFGWDKYYVSSMIFKLNSFSDFMWHLVDITNGIRKLIEAFEEETETENIMNREAINEMEMEVSYKAISEYEKTLKDYIDRLRKKQEECQEEEIETSVIVHIDNLKNIIKEYAEKTVNGEYSIFDVTDITGVSYKCDNFMDSIKNIINRHARNVLNKVYDIGEAIDKIKILIGIENETDYKRYADKLKETTQALEGLLTTEIKDLLIQEIIRILDGETHAGAYEIDCSYLFEPDGSNNLFDMFTKALFDIIPERTIEELQIIHCKQSRRKRQIRMPI